MYSHLQYFVPMPGKKKKDGSGKRQRLELLKDISGATVPGQLTALIGGSGAGKVSLLMAADILPWPSLPWTAATDSHAQAFAPMKSKLTCRHCLTSIIRGVSLLAPKSA